MKYRLDFDRVLAYVVAEDGTRRTIRSVGVLYNDRDGDLVVAKDGVVHLKKNARDGKPLMEPALFSLSLGGGEVYGLRMSEVSPREVRKLMKRYGSKKDHRELKRHVKLWRRSHGISSDAR